MKELYMSVDETKATFMNSMIKDSNKSVHGLNNYFKNLEKLENIMIENHDKDYDKDLSQKIISYTDFKEHANANANANNLNDIYYEDEMLYRTFDFTPPPVVRQRTIYGYNNTLNGLDNALSVLDLKPPPLVRQNAIKNLI